MVPSWMASMVAPMASMVAPLASMVEMDWWKQMTAESRNDDKRVDGLIKRFVYERADGFDSQDS